MIPAFRQIGTSIKELQRIQTSLARIFNAIQAKEILDGRLISNVSLVSSSTNSIDHGLGKPIRGWIIVGKNANATVYSSVSSTPNATLILNTTADVTISLWVF